MSKKIQRLKQEQFFALTEWLRNQREEVAKLDTLEKVAVAAAASLDFEVSTFSAKTALKLTGVEMAPKVSPQTGGGAKGLKTGRSLVRAVLDLFEAFDMPVPDHLRETYLRLTGKEYKKPLPPVPVKSVTPAKDIPVVNVVSVDTNSKKGA